MVSIAEMTEALATMADTETKHALVVGLGVTGLSCVRFLARRGYRVRGVDSRAQPPKLEQIRREFPNVELHVGGLDTPWFDEPGMLVMSPGMSLHEPAIARALELGWEPVGDIELFARAVRECTSPGLARRPAGMQEGRATQGAVAESAIGPRGDVQGSTSPGPRGSAIGPRGEAAAPIIAITGSNGKSTVTALVGAMCRAAGLDVAIGGNIGVPALDLLDNAERDAYVLELSSFQLETTNSLNPLAATVLNLSCDHMDRYSNLDDYAAAKARIFGASGVQVLNADDLRVLAMARPDRSIVRFGLNPPKSKTDYGLAPHGEELWLKRGAQPLMPAREVPLPGRHNLANVLVSMALAEIAGVPIAAQREATRRFMGLPHRTEIVAQRDGIQWINDSKGTNVGATAAALSGMTGPVVLIAGGDGKGADFSELRPVVARHARAVVLIGRDAGRIEAALANATPLHHARDMRAAVVRARELARPGDVVLLSPACASFDMFRNYQHRGEVFKTTVKEVMQ